jgi:hypothetical protein
LNAPYSFDAHAGVLVRIVRRVLAMPLSSRSRFFLAAMLVLTLLAWPRAVLRPGINALPASFVVVAAAAFVSMAVRVGHAYAGRAPIVPRAVGLDLCLALSSTIALFGSRERPVNGSGNRPANALFGPLAELYDPCERGEGRLVRSGVAPRFGYVCEQGYTTRICASAGCSGDPLPNLEGSP